MAEEVTKLITLLSENGSALLALAQSSAAAAERDSKAQAIIASNADACKALQSMAGARSLVCTHFALSSSDFLTCSQMTLLCSSAATTPTKRLFWISSRTACLASTPLSSSLASSRATLFSARFVDESFLVLRLLTFTTRPTATP